MAGDAPSRERRFAASLYAIMRTAASAFALEAGFEFGAAIDPDGADGEGHGVPEFVGEAFGVARLRPGRMSSGRRGRMR